MWKFAEYLPSFELFLFCFVFNGKYFAFIFKSWIALLTFYGSTNKLRISASSSLQKTLRAYE